MCWQCLSCLIETNEGPLTYWYQLKTSQRAIAGKAQIRKNDGWIPFSCSAHLFGSWPDTLMHEVQTHSGHIYHNAVPLIHALKRRLSNRMQPMQGSNEGNGDAATTAGHSCESCEVWHRAKRDWVSRSKISWTLIVGQQLCRWTPLAAEVDPPADTSWASKYWDACSPPRISRCEETEWSL